MRFLSIVLIIVGIGVDAADNRVVLKRGRISIVPPVGFVKVDGSIGFAQKKTGARIRITSIPSSFAAVLQAFNTKALKARQLIELERQSVRIEGKPGRLFLLQQKAYGLQYLKWVLIFATDNGTPLVVGECPAGVKEKISPLLRKALLSSRSTETEKRRLDDSWAGMTARFVGQLAVDSRFVLAGTPVKGVGAVDGDTAIVVNRANKRIEVDLAGIDSPELDQPYGKKAREFLAELVKGKMLGLDPAVGNAESQGAKGVLCEVEMRTVRDDEEALEVETSFGFLSEVMVLNGYAWHIKPAKEINGTIYSDRRLAKDERIARKEQAGLWADKEAIPPWEWRRRKK